MKRSLKKIAGFGAGAIVESVFYTSHKNLPLEEENREQWETLRGKRYRRTAVGGMLKKQEGHRRVKKGTLV